MRTPDRSSRASVASNNHAGGGMSGGGGGVDRPRSLTTTPSSSSASASSNNTSTLTSSPSSFQASGPELQFSLLPLWQSRDGSVTALARHADCIFVGTDRGFIIQLELEIDDAEEEGPIALPARSNSALRPALASAAPFALTRIESRHSIDARKHHSKRSNGAGITDMQLCPALGVIFALAEGQICLYDLVDLKFQHRVVLSSGTNGLIERFALYPSATSFDATIRPLDQIIQLACSVGKKLYIAARQLNGSNQTLPLTSPAAQWVIQQELLLPEPVRAMIWMDSVHIMLAFKKEYSIIDTCTGDVMDLCSVESGTAETLLHRLSTPGEPRTLLHAGTKALLHFQDGPNHVLADAFPFPTSAPPLALGSSGGFVFALENSYLHIFSQVAARRNGNSQAVAAVKWRVAQNLPVRQASVLFSDGGPLVILSKQSQLYFLQPMEAHDKHSDHLVMMTIQINYFHAGPNSPWSREDASKALSTHVQEQLSGRTHPFALMIRAFAYQLLHQIHSIRAAALSSKDANSTADSNSTTNSAVTPLILTAAARAPLIHSIRDFQRFVSQCMQVMWSEVCNPQPPPALTQSAKGKATAARNDSNAAAEEFVVKPNFLVECMGMFIEAMWRRIYPIMLPIYATACAADDTEFVDACARSIDSHITMETFGSSILQKSPWLNKSTISEQGESESENSNESKGIEITRKVTPIKADDDIANSLPISGSPTRVPLERLSASFHPLSPNPLLVKAFERTTPIRMTSDSTPVSPNVSREKGANWPVSLGTKSDRVRFTLLLDSYSQSIALIKMLPLLQSPVSQLRLLAKVQMQLLKDSQALYDPTEKKLFTMSADELLPIFCFVLIHSRLTQPYAIVELLQDTIEDDAAIGVDGYVMATLQMALAQITHKEAHSNGATPRPPNSPLLSSLTANPFTPFLPETPLSPAQMSSSPPPATASPTSAVVTTPVAITRISDAFTPASRGSSFIGTPLLSGLTAASPASNTAGRIVSDTIDSPAMLIRSSLSRSESAGIGSALLSAGTLKNSRTNSGENGLPPQPSPLQPIPSTVTEASSPMSPSSPMRSADFLAAIDGSDSKVCPLELKAIPQQSWESVNGVAIQRTNSLTPSPNAATLTPSSSRALGTSSLAASSAAASTSNSMMNRPPSHLHAMISAQTVASLSPSHAATVANRTVSK